MKLTGSEKLPYISDQSQFSYTKRCCPQKSHFFEFLSVVFLNILNFTKKYPPRYEVLGSMQKTQCGELLWIRDYAQLI